MASERITLKVHNVLTSQGGKICSGSRAYFPHTSNGQFGSGEPYSALQHTRGPKTDLNHVGSHPGIILATRSLNDLQQSVEDRHDDDMALLH